MVYLKIQRQLGWGSILSYFQLALNIIIGMAYTPIMLRILGQSEYGLYSTASSTMSMMSILSMGFNVSYIRFYSRYKTNYDTVSINRLNGLYVSVFSLIGLVVLLCGGYLSSHLNIVFDNGLTVEEYELAKVLMRILTVSMAISFPATIYTNIISAHERFVFLKLLGMLRTVVSPLITLPLLLMGYRSVAMVSVSLAVSLVTDLLYFIYCRKILEIKFEFRNFERGLLAEMISYSGLIALQLIADQVNNNLGKVLLGRFNGTESVAVYSVGYTLYRYFMLFSIAISGVFTPRIHSIVNQTKGNENLRTIRITQLFTRVGRLQYMLLALILTGFAFFGKSFIYFWAGEGYSESYYVGLILMIGISIDLIQNLGIEIQRALNVHSFRSIVYVVMACISAVLISVLCQRFGAIGAALGSAVAFVIANGIAMNIHYQKKCNVDILLFWKNICSISKGLIIPAIMGFFVCSMVKFESVGSMLLGMVIYIIVYCISMWFFGINHSEKQLITSMMSRLVHSFKK